MNSGRSINILSDKLENTIKELKQNNIELEKDIEERSKIDEMRKQFISDVSHELKTPIALIQGYAEGLVDNVATDAESKKFYSEVILDEANKMDKLVKQLLELMKLEYGKREFNDKEFKHFVISCKNEKNIDKIMNELTNEILNNEKWYPSKMEKSYKDSSNQSTIKINKKTTSLKNILRCLVCHKPFVVKFKAMFSEVSLNCVFCKTTKNIKIKDINEYKKKRNKLFL